MMHSTEYDVTDEKLDLSKLILRDYLALDRTTSANERTLLPYLRTAIMLLISGVTIIKLFEGNIIMVVFGTLLMPLGLVVAVIGYVRFRQVRVKIHWSNQQPYAEVSELDQRFPSPQT